MLINIEFNNKKTNSVKLVNSIKYENYFNDLAKLTNCSFLFLGWKQGASLEIRKTIQVKAWIEIGQWKPNFLLDIKLSNEEYYLITACHEAGHLLNYKRNKNLLTDEELAWETGLTIYQLIVGSNPPAEWWEVRKRCLASYN